MTSNQIANAANLEQARHNAATEEETVRHNKEVESIDRQKNEITKNYNENQYNLQSQYNEKYLEYLNASDTRKAELESQLNGIKQMQADADAVYKSEMTAYNNRLLEIESGYKSALSTSSLMNAAVQAKASYYEQQKTEAQTSLISAQIENMQKQLALDAKRIATSAKDAETRRQELLQREKEFGQELRRYEEIVKPSEQVKYNTDWANMLRTQLSTAAKVIESYVDIINPFNK